MNPRCSECGKFKAHWQVVTMLGDNYDEWDECWWCMSQSDFEMYSPVLEFSGRTKELERIKAERLK